MNKELNTKKNNKNLFNKIYCFCHCQSSSCPGCKNDLNVSTCLKILIFYKNIHKCKKI